MSRFQVKKVAVLGAGVMGAQIAAHLVNVKVPVVLFDLPAKEGPKNGIVTKAVEGLKKLKPAPLGVADDAALIQQDGRGPPRKAPVARLGIAVLQPGPQRQHGGS
ncbi:3-hydroxyacyl-CoA dehydrogenase NAD-binding domain-containing protein, partial [Acidovorax sp. NPDC077664]|uniref:3-hydroxyacyl-CoA dehydrogenase NAD-binding domain-containing protein n=1 Tax=Acidovorax sp. NPDC077664 TaxID=3390544 RepID=UPI003CFE89B8